LEEGRFTTGAARYHHIFVDEFQDINPLDLALIKAIARANKAKLTIVGDDDQAIYEWRGATPEFILEPERHLGGKYETCILTTNYRSPRNIVHLSQALIAHNERRVAKEVNAAQPSEAYVEIRRFSSISKAIGDTVKLVKALLDDGQYKSVALISRKRSQIIPYQILFAGLNIPFYAAEDLHVLLSEAFLEMKNILAIRGRESMGGMFGVDPVQDVLKLCDKIKRYPIAKKDREELRRHLYQAQPSNLHEGAKALAKYTGPLKGSNVDGRMSASFANAISHLITAKTVSESIHALSDNFEGLQKDYGKALEDIFYTDPPFLYLADFAERYGSDYTAFYKDIEKAIATLARVSPDDEQDDKDDKELEWKRPLHLMTALRAKGKEFDAVIVLDANDGIWPGKLAKTKNDLEQERRLFYVAMTRARRCLYFILNDSILGEARSPSPYLAEMGLHIPTTIIES
jgi:DNA helicase-2/ATP-dependent DNA helicase PcrA